ncbi:MAG: cell division protein FtsA [Alphaproteobacteria bacterium]|nr:cell division protein FtsA [Alphaproteobacteria bacterium]
MPSFHPKGSVIAALDVGSSKIACFIGRIRDENGNIDVIGVGHQASQGIKAGTVVDLDLAESAIRQSVHTAEKMAADVTKGYPLREVIVNVPAIHTRSHLMNMNVQIMGQAITDNDIRRAMAKAQSQIMAPESELIHTIPTSYRIDGHDGIQEPRGLYGQNLDVDIHIVTGASAPLRNIAGCIQASHLDITALCAAPYASGLACLVDDEMDMGCVVVDMGGGTTGIAIFYGKEMIFTDSVPVGGQHVTNDIAKGLTTSIQAAERMKALYGSAIATSTDDKDLIDVHPLGEEDPIQPNHIPRSYLVSIIAPRLEETLELVRAKIADSGLSHVAGRRVVLTGGASQIPGLRELAQKYLEKQVRLGRPLRLPGLADSVSGPAFSTTAGLLHYVTERADEMPAEIMASVEDATLWERVKLWLRENW